MGAYQGVPLVTGGLAQAIEGGGKRRIFARCNYIKQRLLHPVHIWAMTVLSSLKTDATDRWPLSVIYTLIEMIWGSTLASSIVNSSLGLNTFLVSPPMVKKFSEVAFLTEQPLGYYGSWSLFSLSHHYIVWLATLKAYPLRSTPFVDYALLGDDILITDKKVANQYNRLLDRLSVTISFAKSIVSENGTIEFAQRFWIRDMQKDIFSNSLKALTSCRTTVGLCQLSCRYSIEISTLQRLAGAGYKVPSRLRSTQSPRWERLKAPACKPNKLHLLPLEFWIGRRRPHPSILI
ncbi:hypothetical protein KY289_011291 [Solanum tuberosum]|nr:hypothetical protein KY289_011291 [Solanum tuberosum]